jgi:hypothetical protein
VCGAASSAAHSLPRHAPPTAAMRPGTVDYSRWDAMGDSSEEEEDERRMPAAPARPLGGGGGTGPETPAPAAAARETEARPQDVQRFSLQQLCDTLDGCVQRWGRALSAPWGTLAPQRLAPGTADASRVASPCAHALRCRARAARARAAYSSAARGRSRSWRRRCETTLHGGVPRCAPATRRSHPPSCVSTPPCAPHAKPSSWCVPACLRRLA